MKNGLLVLLIAALCSCASSRYGISKDFIREKQNFAAAQYKILAAQTPADSMPKNFNAATGRYEKSNTKWWCSGFYPGSLWLIYEATGDAAIKTEAEKRLDTLEKEQFYTGNHDLGFMMYCSFGNAYRITQNPKYKPVIFQAAQSLSTRYRPAIQSIQSWNKNQKFNCPVIIDNMMNLELLEWVTQQGGDKKFHTIATTHANSTMKNHYRADYSAYHVLDYDLETGKLMRRLNHQGYNDESAWSRGQAWGLYGFVMMHRFNKNAGYLAQARHIANFLLNHPNLPADKIPYWDFNAPTIPNTKRDASAAAIMASALLELSQYSSGAEKKNYTDVAAQILKTLSSPDYLAAPGTNGGFLLKHSVGFFNANSEVDVGISYADYYYLEALKRYKDWVL